MHLKPLIEWNDELRLGIQEIDEQHKILVEIINRLYGAIVTRTEATVIDDIVDELVQYTIVHFAVEECLQRLFKYPHYSHHRAVHGELTQQVLDFQDKVGKGQDPGGKDLLNFLRKWLTHHIQNEDKQYVPYLLKGGIEASWSEAEAKSWKGKLWSFVKPRKP